MKKSFILFLVSLTVTALTLLLSTFWDALGLGQDYQILAFILIFSALLSTIGLIIGITEYVSNKNKKTLIGIIGNGLIVLFVVGMMVYALMTLDQ